MIQITYFQMVMFITIQWIITRFAIFLKNKKFDLIRELKLLLVYICIIVIARCVYFPFHHVNGHIGLLNIDLKKTFPVKFNLIPIVRLSETYDGWKTNIIGNITMFIPVGLVWPLCFKQLNSVIKTTLAGTLFSLLIELTQIMSYERCSDIDDIILNTTGVFIGSIIFFAIKKITGKKL